MKLYTSLLNKVTKENTKVYKVILWKIHVLMTWKTETLSWLKS